MSTPSVYINFEDDVSKIVTRLKHISAKQIVLVCPKRCFLFNDSINLRLLKKQIDLMGKELFILTMDERGQLYAKEAGFSLKFLPKGHGSSAMSDVRVAKKPVAQQESEQNTESPLDNAVTEIKNFATKLVPASLMTHEPAKVVAKVRKPSSVIPKIEVVDQFFPEEIEKNYREEKIEKKSHTQKIVTGLVALSLIVALVLFFVILPKASVVVFAKTEPVTRDMEISMSTNISLAEPAKLTMPATKVDETINLGGTYQSQGKKQVGNKASGTVKIYNFTKLPLNLKAATTILTVGSKTYSLVNDIAGLKPTTYKNQKTKEVDINSLADSVDVVATDGGEDFNLPAGTRMEITNQVFGSKPLLLYAKTDTAIANGTTRYLSVISQDDIDAAKTDLSAKALQEINDKLKSSGLILPEKSYSFDVAQFMTDNPVGGQAPSFQATIQVKVSGIAFKDADLKTLISQRISQTLAANKTLEDKDVNSTSVKVKTYDPINQLASLAVHYEGQAVYDLNLPNIEKELVGKSQNDANEILRSKAEIDRVEITLAPSWQKNFPWFASKIKVSISK